MSKPKKQKEYKPLPPVSGILSCENRHTWQVILLNPERQKVNCPVCGAITLISGLETYDRQQGKR